MNVLLKVILLQLIILNTHIEIYSMESSSNLQNSSSFPNMLYYNNYQYNTSNANYNTTSNYNTSNDGTPSSSVLNSLFYSNVIDKNSEYYPEYNTNVNYLHNNIYDPSIFDYIRQKRKNITNIINEPGNEPEFVLLDLNKLCSVNKEIYDKYLNLKKKVDKSTSSINKCISNISEIENKYRNSCSTIHTRTQSNERVQYVTNALNNIIIDKQAQINNMTEVIKQLTNIQSMATTYNINGCIEEYIRVSKLLLQYDILQDKQESYIDLFNKKMEIFLQENKNLDRNDNKKVYALLTNFNTEHSQFIEKVQNRINTKKKRIDNVIQHTINKMQNINSFIFIVDKDKCICNTLLEEIKDITDNINTKLLNHDTRIYFNEKDDTIYEQMALHELTDMERILIKKPINSLLEILNKIVLFNSNDTKLINEADNIINNIKIELGQYIK